MIRIPAVATMAVLLTLAACGDKAEESAVAETPATQDTGFGGDIAAATRQAAADTEAAAREAGAMDAPVDRPATPAAVSAPPPPPPSPTAESKDTPAVDPAE